MLIIMPFSSRAAKGRRHQVCVCVCVCGNVCLYMRACMYERQRERACCVCVSGCTWYPRGVQRAHLSLYKTPHCQGPNTRLPRSSCSTLLLPKQTKPTTMSSLTLLTATVVVLGLWCWVPIDAFNPRMASCNRTTMPVVTNLSLADWAGRWYQSHISTNGWTTFQYDAVASDVQITIPLAQDRRGQVDQDFIVGWNTFINPATGNCSYSWWLDEVIDGKMSGAYQAQIYPWPVYGYYISWNDSYVLATDYTSTSVILTEKNVNGYTDITFADIRVFVRNATLAPDAAVVDAALNGFCQGAFLDLSSNFYEQIPTDSDLPCFAPPAK